MFLMSLVIAFLLGADFLAINNECLLVQSSKIDLTGVLETQEAPFYTPLRHPLIEYSSPSPRGM